MQMGKNPFYANAEANAYDILQQMLIKETQRSNQQTMMELAAMKALFGQGQFLFCIPCGGLNYPSPCFPLPLCPMNGFVGSPESILPDSHRLPALPPPPCPPPPPPPTSPPEPPPPPCTPNQQITKQSVVQVNLKNGQFKTIGTKAGPDDCNLGADGINVKIDLREYLPAEIILDVDEKSIEIKARHVDTQGCRTFSRRYDLPACINLDSVNCFLTHDGYLLFYAGWCKMECT